MPIHVTPTQLHRSNTPHGQSDTTTTTRAHRDHLAAWIHNSQNSPTLPVAAPLVPHQRASAMVDIDRLWEVNPATTSPQMLATLVLPHIEHGGHRACPAIKSIVMGLQGERLTSFKTHLERQSPGSLLNFVFKQCPTALRDAIIAHVGHHAPAQVTEPYILSDIDNTVCPSRDERYPRSTVSYPGRAALWKSILGPCAPSERTCFLSARFGDAVLPWKLLSRHERNVTFANLARVGIDNPKVLFGSVRDLPYPTPRGINMSPLGSKKIKNFEMLRSLYPEYRYVFFGDTCEDDLRVGRAMLKTAPKHMGAVFIHDFGAGGQHFAAAERAVAQQEGVIFYHTAPGAAVQAFLRDLLGLTVVELQAIAADAQREFETIAWTSSEQRNNAWALLRSDLAVVDDICEKHAHGAA